MKTLTKGQQRRNARDRKIALLAAGGLSIRTIADLVNLAPSRVHAIVDRQRSTLPKSERRKILPSVDPARN